MKIDGGALPHWGGALFGGAKAALLCAAGLVVLRRDRTPGISWPGWIDLPGGGRSGDESPLETVRREILEEVSLDLPNHRFHWARAYESAEGPPNWFLAAEISEHEAARLRLGDEGLACWIMPTAHFLTHPKVAPMFRERLTDYLAQHP